VFIERLVDMISNHFKNVQNYQSNLCAFSETHVGRLSLCSKALFALSSLFFPGPRHHATSSLTMNETPARRSLVGGHVPGGQTHSMRSVAAPVSRLSQIQTSLNLSFGMAVDALFDL